VEDFEILIEPNFPGLFSQSLVIQEMLFSMVCQFKSHGLVTRGL